MPCKSQPVRSSKRKTAAAVVEALLSDPEVREHLREAREAMQRGERPIPFKQVQAEARSRRGGTSI